MVEQHRQRVPEILLVDLHDLQLGEEQVGEGDRQPPAIQTSRCSASPCTHWRRGAPARPPTACDIIPYGADSAAGTIGEGRIPERPTIAFFPEGAFGPTNNCVGMANVLRLRGARVVFVVEESFAGTLEAKGFEEALMRLKPKPEVDETAGQFWKDFIRETAPQFRRPTLEQLETLIKPIWEELTDGARYAQAQLAEIYAEVRPDVIVQDNVVAFPAVLTAGVPWVRIVSCNPLEVKDPSLPPAFSGYPTGDPTGWDRFRQRYRELHEDLWSEFDAFCRDSGAPPLARLEFIHTSPWLNLYLFPRELDYLRSTPLGPEWHRLESCVRDTDATFAVPQSLGSVGSLIYLSLGSLGSSDVDLMQRVIDVLARSDHRVIVSMGPRHEELSLAGNMVGAEFLPQASILPLVDLVITHGGNNTVTEALNFGKPMVILPLFWDQYDNAQRVHEMGFGIRLASYEFEDVQLLGAIDALLKNDRLRRRLESVAARLRSHPGTERAANLIESVGGQAR